MSQQLFRKRTREASVAAATQGHGHPATSRYDRRSIVTSWVGLLREADFRDADLFLSDPFGISQVRAGSESNFKRPVFHLGETSTLWLAKIS